MKQNRFGKDRGNCLQACVATVLELSLDTVPDFCSMYPGNEWLPALEEWTRQFGLSAILLVPDSDVAFEEFLSHPVVCIVTGMSDRNSLHSVIWDGRTATWHDPHPSNAGIKAPYKDIIYFVACNPARRAHV